MDHPRLYFTGSELAALRAGGAHPGRARLWENLMGAADWCLTRPRRRAWIPPVTPDPVHANLYDRFYAMMHDMAVMEHLAFARCYGGDERHGRAAVEWVLAGCRIWSREADGQPDGGKAYAVSRLLKGLAVCYDLLHAGLGPAARTELRTTIARIATTYYDGYFASPAVAGAAFHTHHASVEWASFGLAALALLGEHPPAEQWLRATVAKFRAHLLPLGLAADGAQVEGPTFWASTMQYRLAFLDALRRVTGEDLFAAHAAAMDARLALASIAAPKSAGHDEDHQTVILQPSYGQLGYYSPVLLGLARFYRRPLYQYLAAWDHTAGSVQRTRYVTANGEWLLFAWGGNACAWFDPTVPAEAEAGAPLAFAFPSVGEAYLRSSYAPGDVVLGLRHGTAVIHAGGRAVLVDLSDGRTGAEGGDLSVKDDGRTGIVRDHGPAGCSGQVVRLQRPGRLVLARRTDTEQAFWCHGQPIRAGSRLRWPDGTELAVTRGSLATIAPAGYHDEKVVGLGLLRLQDPAPMVYPLVRVRPDQGRLEVQVAAAGHATEART